MVVWYHKAIHPSGAPPCHSEPVPVEDQRIVVLKLEAGRIRFHIEPIEDEQ